MDAWRPTRYGLLPLLWMICHLTSLSFKSSSLKWERNVTHNSEDGCEEQMRLIHRRATLPSSRPWRNGSWWRISVIRGLLRENRYASTLHGLILHFPKTPRVESGHFPRPFLVLRLWDRIPSWEMFLQSGKWDISSGVAPSKPALQAKTGLESFSLRRHFLLLHLWFHFSHG